jgi:hypothetical protein
LSREIGQLFEEAQGGPGDLGGGAVRLLGTIFRNASS